MKQLLLIFLFLSSMLFGAESFISDLLMGPNPLDPLQTTAKFQFETTKPGTCDYRIYSIIGEEVVRGFSVITGSGTNFISWDGFNDYGEMLANGVYIAYFRFESYIGDVENLKLKIAIYKQ
jgi:hypothetical protein